MNQSFNIASEYSRALDELRGPERRHSPLHEARAWVEVSSARRTALRVLAGALSIGALAGFASKVASSRKDVRKILKKKAA